MSLIDFTGFENQTNNMLHPFFNDYGGLSASYFDYSNDTRFGSGRCAYLSIATAFNLVKYFSSNYEEVIFGIACKRGTTEYSWTISFGNNDDNEQATVIFSGPAGSVSYKKGSAYDPTIYTSDSNLFDVSKWNFFEVKMKLSNTSGYIQARVNGVPLYLLSGIDTLNTGSNEYINRIRFSGRGAARYDDIYICDNSGSENNDFLGNVRVDAIYPTANGNQNDGTASAGSNYECVDELDANGDTDYVALDALNEIELYAFGDLPVTTYTKTIYGIKINYQARKTDAAARTLAGVFRINGTNYTYSSNTILSVEHEFFGEVWELNPDDSSVWEETDINAFEAGVKVTT